jgi:oligopeptide/dipeptide ABC transporter ATP-binding protein
MTGGASSTPPADGPLLVVRGLTKHYSVGRAFTPKTLTAVDHIDFTLRRGETLALVGESGSGKSTVARTIVRLVEPSSGEVELDGEDLTALKRAELAKRYRRIQMVFQDPNSSLNPRMTVEQVLAEPLKLHLGLRGAARSSRIRELVGLVGLQDEHLHRLPHQLSGGQRQRVGIARAIAVEPQVVILDEPTSSLDVSVRAKILELLRDLQERLDLAYLFISHDLHVVRGFAHRVAVMYLGGIVESGDTDRVFADPVHPYTRALLSAAPIAQWGRQPDRLQLLGEIPSPVDLPPGCRLADRCPYAEATCRVQRPDLVELDAGHAAACPVMSKQRQLVAGVRPPTA